MDGNRKLKDYIGWQNIDEIKKRTHNNALPIVGLEVGAIGSSSFVSFGSGGTFAIWLLVVIFI